MQAATTRFCTKSRRAKVRQGKNRRGSGVYVLYMSIPSLFLTQHHRAQPLFVQSLVCVRALYDICFKEGKGIGCDHS
ncbi:hypothetical protein GIW26_13635 [Pseudomonas syringae]|uniref:Uncharacterized protein n=1 Tax=Pseudomonas avellanae TaxID=46257 RepID=A0AAD0GN41_9PSED|nr:hypothetical protein BKM03_00935 [Pseudomonas avellanae]MCF8984616.1 hypothetical protein [Pseudomonas syringae]MCF9005334.1 hypothetical protein [Pseudomonas syringae]POP71902.1 hypothetical protein CXB34_30460 [Pseudomonas amygdali pv. morsprunorum]